MNGVLQFGFERKEMEVAEIVFFVTSTPDGKVANPQSPHRLVLKMKKIQSEARVGSNGPKPKVSVWSWGVI
jgi:hypothetical protein